MTWKINTDKILVRGDFLMSDAMTKCVSELFSLTDEDSRAVLDLTPIMDLSLHSLHLIPAADLTPTMHLSLHSFHLLPAATSQPFYLLILLRIYWTLNGTVNSIHSGKLICLGKLVLTGSLYSTIVDFDQSKVRSSVCLGFTLKRNSSRGP